MGDGATAQNPPASPLTIIAGEAERDGGLGEQSEDERGGGRCV